MAEHKYKNCDLYKRLSDLADQGRDGTNWQTITDGFIKKISEILSVPDEFFKNYTEHGIEHIENVLMYAEKLIDPQTLNELSAKSIAVLIMAAVSHDIGMFIHYSGLKDILKKDEWAKRWDEYRRELGQMSDSRAEEIFGTYHRGTNDLRLPSAKEILKSNDKLIDDDWKKLLCGEFLRRFHHLLAEDCIKNGFPFGNGEKTDLFGNCAPKDSRIKAVIALLARSHGESMEQNEKLVEKTNGYSRTRQGWLLEIPVYLHMAVIRLADYIDAGAERASWIKLCMNEVDQPTSKQEFLWNQFVNMPRERFSDDSESVYIDVAHEYDNKRITGTIFQKIEHWMHSVQRELDISWRYLAMKYKGEPSSSKLSIRRLDSNIMDEKDRDRFAESIVLEPASLSAAPEVLGLLIEPLYDSNPGYGVRELLQNAVDACREREALGSGYKGKVKVSVDTRSKTPSFRMIDNGIGMTKEVILKYFLKVGSSYRNSDEWKNKYEGRFVERTGRFGIGVLAAFLLGEEVSVATLPKGEERGYVFSIKKDEYKPIDIARAGGEDERIEKLLQTGGGTIIDIVPNAKAVKALSDTDNVSFDPWTPYGWYYLSDPEVLYEVNGSKIPAEEMIADGVITNWLVLGEFEEEKLKKQDELGMSFKWSYERALGCECICNGFAVDELSYQSGSFFARFLPISPTVFVADVKNKALLALNRNTLYLDNEIAAMLDEERFMLALANSMIARIDTIYVAPFTDLSIPFAFIRLSEIMLDVPYLAAKSGINTAIVCKRDWTDAWINILGNGQLDWSATPLLLRNESTLLRPGIRIGALGCDSAISTGPSIAADIIGYARPGEWRRKYDRDIYCVSGKDVSFTFAESIVKEVAENEDVLGAVHFDFSASEEPPNEIKAILDKYFELDSKDPWIPFELSERIKKFPRFFDKNDIMYKKYMDYLDKAADHDRYYSLDAVEAARKKAEASRKE